MPGAQFSRVLFRDSGEQESDRPESTPPATWAAPRSLCVGLILTVLVTSTAAAQQRSATTPSALVPSERRMAVIENAVYQARLDGNDLTSGTAEFDVVRHGDGPAVLDWSAVRIALFNLKWNQQPLISGTTADQRMIVLTDRELDQLQGEWSAHGERFGEKILIDLSFPPALNSRLILDLPADRLPLASVGLVEPGAFTPETGLRRWTIELGRAEQTTLRIVPVESEQKPPAPHYEIDTVHYARRDGIFLRSDITVDWPTGRNAPLTLTVPEGLDLQSITMFGSLSQTGVPLTFQRDPDDPMHVILPMASMTLEPRFTLRIRGFESVEWGQMKAVSQIQIADAVETRHVMTVRVDPPLQLQTVDAHGLVQTDLSTDEATGEVWKFEALEPGARLAVEIALPKSAIVADVVCLADLRPRGNWVGVAMSLHVENGSRFEAELRLPEDWELISVEAGDTESRLASWEVQRRRLTVSWQNPMTRASSRKLWLFARIPPWPDDRPNILSLPAISQAGDVSMSYQAVVPDDSELQILEGEGWRLTDGVELDAGVLELPEVAERLSHPQTATVMQLKSSNNHRSGRLKLRLAPRIATEEALLARRTLSGESLAATDVSGTGANSTQQGPQSADAVATMHLVTMVGQSTNRERVHHALLTFDRPVDVSQLDLRLAVNCRLSAVSVDDRSVTVLRDGDQLNFPREVTTASSLRLTYVNSASRSLLYLNDKVPLPRIRFPLVRFDWTLDLPREQRLVEIGLPEILPLEQSTQDDDRRLFGPVSRQPGDGMFNPFLIHDWTHLSRRARAQSSAEVTRQSLQFSAPTAGEFGQFRTWNVAQTRAYAWVALFGCLLIGAASRMFQITWLRRITIVWLALLLLCVNLSSPAWSMVLGGMLAGSVFSILIPRHWIQKRDFLGERRAGRSRIREVATAGAVLAIAFAAQAQNAEDGQQSAEETIAAETALSAPLISSARYEVIETDPAPRVHGVFSVLAPAQTDGAYVRLPFQDVVFDANAECLVDGQSQVLIPAVSGGGVVISLGDRGEPITVSPGNAWTRHQIEIDFTIRDFARIDGGALAFHARVPAVLDSTIVAPNSVPLLRRRGARVRQNEQARAAYLGGLGLLETWKDESTPGTVVDASAVTLLDVSALRIKGQTRIVPGKKGLPAELPLSFPADCLMNSISGADVFDWVTVPGSGEQINTVVRLRVTGSKEPLTITYELPGRSLQGPDLNVPAFPLWNGQNVPHAIGLTGPPGAAFSLVNGSTLTQLSAEEWQKLSERPRPAVTVFLKMPQPIVLQWTHLKSARTANVSEELLVQRDALQWTATVRTSVSQLPAFRHQFRVDPAVRVSEVHAGEAGNESAIRFIRAGNLISVFVPGGQLGEQTFQLTGRIPFQVDSWTPVPALEVIDANLLESQLVIRDETYWNIELETTGGTKVQTTASDAPAGDSADGARALGVFRKSSPSRPSRIRALLPPQATRADSVVRLLTPTDDDWRLISTFHLSATDTALSKAVFHVPPELTDVQVRPSLFQHSLLTDPSGTRITVRIPDRYYNTATLSIAARLTDGFQRQFALAEQRQTAPPAIPLISVLTAQKASQFALLEPSAPVLPAPNAGLRVSGVSFPHWAPDSWRAAVRDESLDCYQQIRADLALQRRSSAAGGGQPLLHLEETVLWPMADGTITGLTRLWLSSQNSGRLKLLNTQELTLQLAMSEEGNVLPSSQVGDGMEIELGRPETLMSILLLWSRPHSPHEFQILQYGAPAPKQRITAIAGAAHAEFDSDQVETLPLIDVWLRRWEALLDCLDGVSASLAVDGMLLQNIRLCQHEADALMSQRSAAVTEQQRKTYQRLNAVWNDRKDALVISAASRPQVDHDFEVSGVFTNLLQSSQRGVPALWLAPEHPDWSGELHATHSWWGIRMGFGTLVLIASIAIVWRYSAVIVDWRNQLSAHPAWSCVLLGMIWWVFLSPSVLGLLFILLAWLVSFLQWGWEAVKQRKKNVSVTS